MDSRSGVIVEDDLLNSVLGGQLTSVRIVLPLREDRRVGGAVGRHGRMGFGQEGGG